MSISLTTIGEKWDAHLDAERRGLRASALSILKELIELLNTAEPIIRREWVLQLVAKVVEDESGIKIRFPLFNQIILPELVAEVLAGRQECARWLAHFDGHFRGSMSQMGSLPESMQSKVGLLLEALRVDPQDQGARRVLVEERSRYLEYTLHELPAGVLYGHDGATISQCVELAGLLEDFRNEVELLGESSIHKKLVESCAFHFNKYRQYLEAKRPGHSYWRFAFGAKA